MTSIRQILFVPPAPVVWAEHCRSFAQHGLAVETTQTLSSDQLGEGLANGSWDVGIAAVDNVIAWNAERDADLRIIAQLERTIVMAFCASSRLTNLADAAREPIAVDATSNGFVLVLYRALARAGIDWRSCRYDKVGGVNQRYDALVAGNATATILVPPFIDLALARGFSKLWDGASIAPAYPGVVVAARAAWLSECRDAAVRYVQALAAANEWATANPVAAREALLGARYSEGAAERLVREPVRQLAVSLEGWDEVIALRRECGLLPDPAPVAAEVIEQILPASA